MSADDTRIPPGDSHPARREGARLRRSRRKPNGKAAARRVALGDVPPRLAPRAIEQFAVDEAVSAANESKAFAIQDIARRVGEGDSAEMAETFEAIVAGASPDDVLALKNILLRHGRVAETARKEKDDRELAEG